MVNGVYAESSDWSLTDLEGLEVALSMSKELELLDGGTQAEPSVEEAEILAILMVNGYIWMVYEVIFYPRVNLILSNRLGCGGSAALSLIS